MSSNPNQTIPWPENVPISPKHHLDAPLLKTIKNENSSLQIPSTNQIFTQTIKLKRSRIQLKYQNTLEINRVLSFTVTGVNSNTCSICQELISFNQRHFLHCGHNFHCSCIKTWLDMNTTCPYCKQDSQGCLGDETMLNQSNSSSSTNEYIIELRNLFIPDDLPAINGSDIFSDALIIMLLTFSFLISLLKVIIIRAAM